jgi:hypothetical protein
MELYDRILSVARVVDVAQVLEFGMLVQLILGR